MTGRSGFSAIHTTPGDARDWTRDFLLATELQPFPTQVLPALKWIPDCCPFMLPHRICWDPNPAPIPTVLLSYLRIKDPVGSEWCWFGSCILWGDCRPPLWWIAVFQTEKRPLNQKGYISLLVSQGLLSKRKFFVPFNLNTRHRRGWHICTTSLTKPERKL